MMTGRAERYGWRRIPGWILASQLVLGAGWVAAAPPQGKLQTRPVQAPGEPFSLDDLEVDDSAAASSTDSSANSSADSSADSSTSSAASVPEPPKATVKLPEASNDQRLASMDLNGTREVISRYEDQSLKSRARVRSGSGGAVERHGPYVEYYQDGGKFCEGLYVEGKRDGVWKYFFRDGKVAKQGEYSQDKAIGTWYVVRPDQTVERVEEYKDGRQDGKWIGYAADGSSILQVRQFRDGQPHGLWESWYESGKKQYEIEFLDGDRHGRMVLWHPNGQKWSEGQFVEGKRDGQWTWWNDSGQVIQQGTWRDDQRVFGTQAQARN